MVIFYSQGGVLNPSTRNGCIQSKGLPVVQARELQTSSLGDTFSLFKPPYLWHLVTLATGH